MDYNKPASKMVIPKEKHSDLKGLCFIFFFLNIKELNIIGAIYKFIPFLMF